MGLFTFFEQPHFNAPYEFKENPTTFLFPCQDSR